MYKRSLLALAAAVMLALAAGAPAGAADTELQMEQIVVTATRTAVPILASPDHVTVIGEEQIAAAGVLSVAEVLQQVAGVEIADSGTAGSVKSVSIRGSASAQVLVLVDGVRLNDSRQGMADLSQIPVESIERIEVLRGGTSALYGADALGGVVNIITKSRAETPFALRVQNGSYVPRDSVEVYENLPTAAEKRAAGNPLDLVDTQRVSTQLSLPVGPADLLATGSFTRAANGFVWKDNQYIDDYRRRINADLLGGEAFLSLALPLGAGRMVLKGQASYEEVGAPGSIDTTVNPWYGAYFSTDARQQRSAFQGWLSYTTPRFLSSVLTLDATTFYKFSRLDYQNPDPIGSLETAVDDSHKLHSAGLDIAQQLIAFDLAQVVYGGNLLYDHVDSTQIGQKNRISGGVFLEAPLFLFPRLTITPMVRYDLYSDFPAALTYKLSTVCRLTDEASLKASGGKSYRAPTLNDLYWPNDGSSAGNPDLKPETSYSADLGFSLVTGSVEWNLFAFARYVLDGIQWVFTTMYQPQNIGEAVYPGAETDLKLNLFRKIQLTGSYTFLYSYVLKSPDGTYTFRDDRRAAYAPVHKATTAVQYDNGRTLLRMDGQFVVDRFTGVEGELFTRTLDSYFLLNAEARQQLTPNLALSLAGKNLLNQVYQTVNGYAMPPLSFWVGAELRF